MVGWFVAACLVAPFVVALFSCQNKVSLIPEIVGHEGELVQKTKPTQVRTASDHPLNLQYLKHVPSSLSRIQSGCQR